MTDLEQRIFSQVKAIMSDENQAIGRRGVLIPLKKAIIADGDIQNVIDIVATDPALAAHLLMRTNNANSNGGSTSKAKSLKEALIRLGQVNIYRYSFSFYLKEQFDELTHPYQKLVKGYWKLTEEIAEQAIILLHDEPGSKINADELQTLALFSVFGQLIALTAFAYLEQELKQTIPLITVKQLMDTEQYSFSIEAFKSLGLDEQLQNEFFIAHNVVATHDDSSVGLFLQQVLKQKNVILNP
ncbi:MAG: HDOD domain-containing protein [Parashewanella sp.]